VSEELLGLLEQRERHYRDNPLAYWHLPATPLDGKTIMRANPTQLAFHRSLARSRWFIAGNQRGKTVCSKHEVAYWMAHCHPFRKTPDRAIRIRAYALDYLKVNEILLPRLLSCLPPALIAHERGRDGYNSRDHILYVRCRFGGYHEMFFSSYEQEMHKAEGGEFDLLDYDEPPPRHIWEANKVRVAARGGQEIAALTPLQEEMPWDVGWIHTDIVANADGEAIATFHVEGDENLNHLDRATYDEGMSQLSDDQKEVRVCGRFGFLRGLIYREFSTDLHLCDEFDVRERVAQGLGKVYVGLDHGDYRNTAATFHYVEGEGDNARGWIFGEHFDGVGRDVAENCRAILGLLGDLPIEAALADPATWHPDPVTKRVLAELYADAGLPIVPSENDVPKGTEVVRQMLKVPRNASGETWRANPDVATPRLMIFRHAAPQTVASLMRYALRAPRARSGDVGKLVPANRHKHLPDSIRYLWVFGPDGTVRRQPRPMRRDVPTRVPLHMLAQPRRLAPLWRRSIVAV